MVHSAFVGEFFGIPMRSKGGGPDSYTDASLADTLGNLFAYVFLDLDTAQSFKRRIVAKRQTEKLGEVMKTVVADVKSRHSSVMQLVWPDGRQDGLSSYGTRLVERILQTDSSVDSVVWTIIPTAAAASSTQAQGVRELLIIQISSYLILTMILLLSVGPDDRSVPFGQVLFSLGGHQSPFHVRGSSGV